MGYSVYLSGSYEITPPLPKAIVDKINALDNSYGDDGIEYSGIPDGYNPWEIDDDGQLAAKDDMDGAGSYWEGWLHFIVRTFLLPNYTVNGDVEWNGDEHFDMGAAVMQAVPQGQAYYTATPPEDWKRWDKTEHEILLPSSGHAATFPISFEGTAVQKGNNLRSHNWLAVDDEGRECGVCFSREYHVAATYQCGTEPPRKKVLI